MKTAGYIFGALSVFALMACSSGDKSKTADKMDAPVSSSSTAVKTSEAADRSSKAHSGETSSGDYVPTYPEPEGLRLNKLSFATVDKNHDGFLDVDESTSFASDVNYSMDGDDDGIVTLEEFLGWGFGLQNVAVEENREAAYKTALTTIYAYWDENGDGKLTTAEHQKAIIQDIKKSDHNNDGKISEEEYLRYFPFSVAMRSALKK